MTLDPAYLNRQLSTMMHELGYVLTTEDSRFDGTMRTFYRDPDGKYVPFPSGYFTRVKNGNRAQLNLHALDGGWHIWMSNEPDAELRCRKQQDEIVQRLIDGPDTWGKQRWSHPLMPVLNTELHQRLVDGTITHDFLVLENT
jgi:hypothetical protein